MALKENYKNDKYSGKRKYQLIQNEDGTVSLDDVTNYLEVGDIFNADYINATNKAVNNLISTDTVIDLDILASGWTNQMPYSQVVAIKGLKESKPVIGQRYIGTLNQSSINRQDEAWNCVNRITVHNGSIELYCYNQKPAVDFGITMIGGKID